jgi:hypothetical protein
MVTLLLIVGAVVVVGVVVVKHLGKTKVEAEVKAVEAKVVEVVDEVKKKL